MKFPEGSLVRLVRPISQRDAAFVGRIGIVLDNPDEGDSEPEFPTCAWRRDPAREADTIAEGSTHFVEAFDESEIEPVDEPPTEADMRMFEWYCDWCHETGEGSYRKREAYCTNCNPGGVHVPRSQRARVTP